jgi:DNA primase
MKKQNIGFGEALRLLADRVGIAIPSRLEPEAGKDERERLYQANAAAAQYFHNLLLNSSEGEKARNYLASRRLSSKSVTEFQLGFSSNSWEALNKYLVEKGYSGGELVAAGLLIEGEAGETHDRFRNKLMFPIFDARGRITGFGARVLDDSLPKYLNSPQTPVFDKSSTLYGINLAAVTIRQQDRAVVVEGYMDVITAHQNGFNNVVASMGTSLTEKQVSAIKRLTKNMMLALDADAAGEEATLRAVNYENTLNAEVKVIILPQGKDPDDVIRETPETWQRLQEEALPIIDYNFNSVTSGLDLTTAKDKSAAVDKLLPIIAEIKDVVRQAHYLQKLAHLVKVSEHSLEATLGKIRTGQAKGKAKELPTEAATRRLQSLLSSPVEEECLAWLLQYPELKNHYQGLAPEYFENSENREIFLAWQKVNGLPLLREKLDAAVHEHLDSLVAKSLPPTNSDKREASIAGCILRLREKFLRSLAAKREEVLALEAESGGTAAELAKLQEQEQEVEVSKQLGEVFIQKSRRK